MNKALTPKHAFLALAIGISMAAAAFFPAVTVLLPAFLGFIGAAWGTGALVIGIAGAIGGAFIPYFDYSSVMYEMAILIPATLAIFLTLKYKKPYRTGMAITATLMALGIYAAFCLESLIAGNGPFFAVEQMMREFITEFESAAQTLGAGGSETDAIIEYMSVSVGYVKEGTAACIMLSALGFSFFDMLIARALTKKSGVELRPMARFSDWQMGKPTMLGMIILMIGAFVLSIADVGEHAVAMSAVTALVIPVFALCGLSFMTYTSVNSPAGTVGKRVFSYIIFALLLPFSAYMLALLGLIERLFSLRKKIADKKNS